MIFLPIGVVQQQVLSSTPPYTTDLELWYDATDVDTLWTDAGKTTHPSSGQAIRWWDNKAGGALGHLGRPFADFRPTYHSSGSVIFSTDTSMIQTDRVPDDSDFCIFIVCAASADEAAIFELTDNATAPTREQGIVQATTGRYAAFNDDGPVYAYSANNLDDGSAYLITGVFPGMISRSIYVDGVFVETESTTVTGFSPSVVIVGDDGTGTANLSGSIIEVLAYSSIPALSDRGDIEDWLMDKHGL